MDWNVWTGLAIILASILWGLYQTFFVSYRRDIEIEEDEWVGITGIEPEARAPKKKKRKPWYKKIPKWVWAIIIGIITTIFNELTKAGIKLLGL